MLGLLESDIAVGSEFKTFETLLKEIDKNTSCEKVKLEDCSLLTYYESDAKIVNCIHSPQNSRISFKREAILEKSSAPLLEELEKQTKLFLRYGNATYFTSRPMMKTFLQRLELGGNSAFKPCLQRDRYMAHLLLEGNKKHMKLIIRRDPENGITAGKIFAAMGSDYAYIPQETLTGLIYLMQNGLGKMKCSHWCVDNCLSYIYTDFPEKADEIRVVYGLPDEIIPGLYLATSDVGESSLTIRETWKFGRSVVTRREIKWRHSGPVDLDEALETVKREMFSRFTEVPEKLSELITIPVKNPETVISELMEQTGIRKAISKAAAKALTEAMLSEFDPSMSISAYDIAIGFLTLHERCVGLPKSSLMAIEALSVNAVFADYGEKAEVSVMLLPA